MENEKKSKWLKFFNVLGVIGLIVAMFFMGFFIGAYRVNEDERITAFADVSTEYEWEFINFESLGGNPTGQNVWTDGTHYYYSFSPSNYSRNHYVLDTTTSTWSTKTWNGSTTFSGMYIWSDGTNFYYSNATTHYVLDIATSTWSTKTWNYLTNFNGQNIWTDGTNIYYSSSSLHYVLDVATSTWSDKTWYGLSSFNGSSVWSDGTNFYYSNGATQYVLDVSTSTWSTKTWNGFTNIGGTNVWSDGTNIYVSGQTSGQYVLDIATSTWSASDFPLVGSTGAYYFGNLTDGLYYLNTSFFKAGVVSGGGNTPQPNPGADTLVTYFSSSSIPIELDGLCIYDDDATTYYAPPYKGNAYLHFDAYTGLGEDEDLFEVWLELTLGNLYNNSDRSYGLQFVLETDNSETFSIVGTGYKEGYFNSNVDYGENATEDVTIWVRVDWSNLDNVNFQRVTKSSVVSGTTVTDSVLLYVDSDTYLQFTFEHEFNGSTEIANNPNLLYFKGWGNQIYWLSTSFNNDSLYQSGYDAGYSNGVTAGSNSGYDTGYTAGRGDGYNIGYGAGYNAGASDSQYTFVSLIGAVFDAPVQGFKGLFNFNVLGVNLRDFLLGLFSIAIVLTIIKIVLIKK